MNKESQDTKVVQKRIKKKEQSTERKIKEYNTRLLVHCVVGISRSATLVLAYLMIHHQISLIQAIRTVQEKRWISPNTGFLRQLMHLGEELRQPQENQRKSEANQHGEEM
ncbi:unnamed protein product [Ranitomeya imitator]|uniref:Protein-serine/threonine phosphatase n=1 Tax=Ranitomeya imitator TaxID=111125 RepID=A0ABN9MEJ0_9NEOB|nr:unnamed protein product [Ranitomeya imitator]